MTTETRGFQIHRQLLWDVIRRQAGSLHKAILEAVQNSIDAGAAFCEILLDKRSLIIIDDGRGFQSREEIERNFEVFGQPHEENEHKVFGTFRIGRGQMFSFGANVWTSGSYVMRVDIQNKGLDYELEEYVSPPLEGCRVVIQLYSELPPWKLNETVDEIRKWTKFSPIPVLVNQEDISVRPADINWEYQDEDFYLSPDTTHVLNVYNQGIFVMAVSSGTYGVAGDLVTKRPIKVNFARNDIQDTCPVWKAIQAKLRDIFASKISNKKQLNDAERAALARELVRGRRAWNDESFGSAKLLTLCNGSHVTCKHLIRLLRERKFRLGVTVKGDTGGGSVHDSRLCCVLSKETLERFGFPTLERFVQWLHDSLSASGAGYMPEVNYPNLKDLIDTLQRDYKIVPRTEWTQREQDWIALLDYAHYRAETCRSNSQSGRPKHYDKRRDLVVGSHPTSQAFTDGETYIALNRKLLAETPFSLRGLTQFGILIYHELIHDSADTATNVHGLEFLEQYEEYIDSFLPEFITGGESYLRRWQAEKSKRQLAGKTAKHTAAIDEYVTQQNLADRQVNKAEPKTEEGK